LGGIAVSSAAGPVISIALLALYFRDEYNQREQEFIEQLGYQPQIETFNAINDLIAQYNPGSRPHLRPFHGFQSIFTSLEILQNAQSAYLRDFERLRGLNPNVCAADFGFDANLIRLAHEAIATEVTALQFYTTLGESSYREEFPIVDSEAIILVNPANVEAGAYIEGFPKVNIDIELDTNGNYIFIAHEDDADQLGIILGLPIAPDGVIPTVVMMNESQELNDDDIIKKTNS